ncbi:MAG: zinc-binding dehydrogenase [Lentisphaerae bacterium GWF2_44_16]|nr:MAG: zinc-binding dehydrogenase [Lentisphaerae bacterium GWF2_44_16]
MNISTSKAIVLERPRRAQLREIKLTEITRSSIVCRTRLSAVSSGTDMKTWRGQQHPEQCYYPLVPGYENMGIVEYVGPDTDTGLKTGDRVMINECRLFGDVCAAWGGNTLYAIKNRETASSPFDYPVKIPDEVCDKDAVLAYLACVSLKGAKRFSFRKEETILVTGAGMIGISAIQILKLLNPSAKVICIDRSPFRREIAAHYADCVLHGNGSELEKIREFTNGRMADKVMECTGNSEIVGTLHKYIKDGGWGHDDEPAHIHLQGDYPEPIIMDSWHRWFCKNCTVTMSCALAPGCKEQILQWMSEGKFSTAHLPVEIWPAAQCHEAFAYKEAKGENVFKILFDWSGE